MRMLRVAQWNQNGFARGQEQARAELLAGRGVQLLIAQELNAWRFRALDAALGSGWWGVHSLTCTQGLPAVSRYWGVAVFGRGDVAAVAEDGACQVVGDSVDDSGAGLFWRRTLAVPVIVDGRSLTVVSVHVRPGAVVGRQKLQFLENLGAWLGGLDRPLVLGVDANSPGPHGEDHFWSDDPQDPERLTWGPTPAHGLVDVWRDTRAAKHGPGHTHVLRGDRPVRFDHLWISPDLHARSVTHLYDEASRTGSDHATVIADIDLAAAS